ncbi:MAG: carbohydrate ABC transporter substrate-binding protein [Spirochaetales bacterium]|nr:carbohydrate ABC transporter substrate-binding protein [Spirochaetales bacterium]
MNSFKRIMILVLIAATGSFLFASGQQDEGVVELTMMINFGADTATAVAFEEVVNAFNNEYDGIEVTLIAGDANYEALMKSKMATNELPDVWSTHGWSVMRYSEYLLPLNDQGWGDRLNPAIKPVITDSNGNFYVLPLDVDLAGVSYNKSVVKAAGVDIADIRTWDDLFAAMKKIKAIGVTPVHIGGKDNWTIGNFFDWTAPAMYVTDPDNNSSDELLNGDFDTAKWEILAGLFKEMNEKGYMNVDNLTSTFSDSARALAEGSAAFEFYGNYVLTEAWTYNPNAELGFFPVPAFYKSDSPSLISGERAAIGVWKDSEYPEESMLLLNYFTRPENMTKISASSAIPAGFSDVESDTGKLKDDYSRWFGTPAFPYFDRAFLPSGMWDTMCSTGAGILSGDMTTADAAAKMNEDFNRMYK